ncbi:MAG: TetR/AcrR family transcriptional regulator [Bosea sp.]|uniref:TetR/AcrR family transcriptional regulator n=1 Tax=Bosea sp. (in: a-proteobacteria) TaxID=1871050 RepID=UPI002396BF1F|nr:TetR/AcrR family transcriptional regulator [Bosea sp. (in: a-proteobacteria)]MCP4734415.1 TetR/AcrR family transcriptional regulator [Bosea sp. (in: a-proteobacteria)]
MSATLEPRHVKAISRNRRVAGADPEKRHQILEGAHAVFTARGFDAASMNDIAAAANVSKGTLYVYFEDKEHLFVALIEREREKQKQGMYEALAEEPDLNQALMNFGTGLVRLLTNPFALSAHRIVLGVAERMPDLGREFYERGPMQGAQQLAAFLARRVAQGELAIADPALAAAQFVDLSQSTLMRPRLFNAERTPPSEDEIAHVVGEAVATFMARYGAAAKGA